MTTPIIAERLTKTYDELAALNEFSLTTRAGELIALVGHNGSGKSTFLRLAAGLLEPTDGQVRIGGAPAGSLDARAELSFIPDEPVLYDDLSVREHIEYIGRLHLVILTQNVPNKLARKFLNRTCKIEITLLPVCRFAVAAFITY